MKCADYVYCDIASSSTDELRLRVGWHEFKEAPFCFSDFITSQAALTSDGQKMLQPLVDTMKLDARKFSRLPNKSIKAKIRGQQSYETFYDSLNYIDLGTI